MVSFKKINKSESQRIEEFKNEPLKDYADTSNSIDTHSDTHTDMYIDMPWLGMNPKAVRPKKQFILKLNEYYHSLLAYLSNPDEGVSMQKIVNDILLPALDKKAEDIKKNMGDRD